MNIQYIKIDETGNKFYYSKRSMSIRDLHREEEPAIEWADGTRDWYLNGSIQKQKNTKGELTWYINRKSVTEQEYYAHFNAQEN